MHFLRTTILLAAMTALFVIMGLIIGGEDGTLIAFALAALINCAAYWFGDQIVLSQHQARPGGECVAERVAIQIASDLADRAGKPVPRVLFTDNDAPNAFATGRSPKHATLVLSTGLLEILDLKELAAVISHELGHIKARDSLTMTVTATLAGAITVLAGMVALVLTLSRRSTGAGLIVLALLAPIAAAVIQMAIGRSREYAADRYGAELCGDPEWLISALRRLTENRLPDPVAQLAPATAPLFFVNPLDESWWARLMDTHPPIDSRIKRLERMKCSR